MFRIDGKLFSRQSKRQILSDVLQDYEKSTVKHLMMKNISLLLNFVNLSTIFRPRLQNYFALDIMPDLKFQ